MSENTEMPLGLYIQSSLKGAWKLVQAKPNAMEYFDLSSDGFWKSFWAIAVMLPAYALWTYFNLQGGTREIAEGVELAHPFLAEGIFFFTTLPLTAFVMIYFTKWMNISSNYSSMVIAYNWMSALIYLILVSMTMILSSGLVSGELSTALLIMLNFYFGFYVVWYTLKNSLQIGGVFAIGVLLFVKLLETVSMVLLYQIFNPEYFNAVVDTINNQPS
ncbi:hypothetical protein [Pseudemcibacter aquimaris]|uniref:hypothetical protein n=1 Tax=Pseudemcibacter aquimaris TaxID=2857064 RepID=UPI002013A405|nr:hypothetical protein [Pseudemcibacter aquimaris]MCC3861397.1 hypothetical protein [Pseudemcibacter aquimaris]WDU58167.1 hypothetical protein KW060_13315 [Pseudemcibacter aquimaris]